MIIRDQSGADFTRKALVLALANQDGGAHIDPELDEAYEAVSRTNDSVSRADVADLMLRVLDQPETIKEVIGIAS